MLYQIYIYIRQERLHIFSFGAISCLVCGRLRLTTVQIAQVAIPTNADNIDEQQPMVQGHKLEVDKLHKRPEQIVGAQRGRVVLLQLLLGRAPFQHGHTAEEDSDEDGREDALVAGDASEDGRVRGPEVHPVL